MKLALLTFLIVFYTSSFAESSDERHLFVISGVIVNSGASKKIERFVEMIEKRSGYRLKPFYVNSYDRLSETLRHHPDAIAWSCGATFVQDRIKDKQQLVAVPLFNGSPTYGSVIIARKDNSRKSISDFDDGVFAYSDLRSNSGYLSLAIFLKKHGFDIKKFFRLKILTGTHERSIESVYKGLADIAAIDEYIWIEYLRIKPYLAKELHVIKKLGPFPFTPIVAGAGVKKEVLKKIQNSLVNMQESELKTFKNDFHIDGFVVKDASFYDPIKKMLQNMGE